MNSKWGDNMDVIPDDVMVIYRRDKKTFIEALRVAVMLECEYECLPDVLGVLEDKAFRFLFAFAGQTITVPDVRSLSLQARKVGIWMVLGRVDPADRALWDKVVSELAARYMLKRDTVIQVYNAMKQMMDSRGMELRPANAKKD